MGPIETQSSSREGQHKAELLRLCLGLLAVATILPAITLACYAPGYWTAPLILLTSASPFIAAGAVWSGLTGLRARRTRLSFLTLVCGLISFLLLLLVVIIYARLKQAT